jgi:glycosyltransferase involved in cell wall biosynthesis
MYLRHFEVGCLSSREEGFSNAILEYMAAGIPAVATAVGGNGEAIVHGITGYLVQGRNAAEFASHVVGLLRDEEFRKAMGRRAQARCRELFDIHEIVRRHEDYWISLVNQPGRTAPMAARARPSPHPL